MTAQDTSDATPGSEPEALFGPLGAGDSLEGGSFFGVEVEIALATNASANALRLTSDTVAPVVDSFSPSPGSSIVSADSISFRVTDNHGDLASVVVVAEYSNGDVTEMVHDGDSFTVPYDVAGSSRTALVNGFDYTVARDKGWPTSPVKIRVFVVDASGNANLAASAEYTVSDAGGTGVPPVVDNFDPPKGATIERTERISFDVTDDSGLFARILVAVSYDGIGDTDLVHDGDRFTAVYATRSSRVAIPNGYRYTIGHVSGWPSAPRVRIFPVDAEGNE